MKQIIAMGGGGFSMDPDNSLLDEYILKQSKKDRPKICFMPTASGDADGYVERFYQAFNKLDCEPSHLSLFNPPSRDLESFVLDHDIIYVGGGSTKNMLALWREWELDHILRDAWNLGIILAGFSAGALCWFEQGVTDSYRDRLSPITGLGWIKGSYCPHYNDEPLRKSAYTEFVSNHMIQSGYGVDDGAALHIIGQEVTKAISSRPDAKAYYLEPVAGLISEKEVEMIYLGE